MEVYALVGSSGTGKSHRAMVVAYEHDIDTIIDDGLLIKEGCKLAGKSAKREATALQAVKRAIFLDKEHAAEVKKCLERENPERILVLGTSLRMIQRIADSLDLPKPSKIINIEDVATDQEIKIAQNLREAHGMHVIPVPTVEIKKDFPGYLVDPLKYFFRRKNEVRRTIGEKSIIRPKFSLIGKLVISEHAVSQIVTYVSLQIPGVSHVHRVHVEMNEEGVRIREEIVVRFGMYLPEVGAQVKALVQKHLESITGLIVYGVEVIIRSLDLQTDKG